MLPTHTTYDKTYTSSDKCRSEIALNNKARLRARKAETCPKLAFRKEIKTTDINYGDTHKTPA